MTGVASVTTTKNVHIFWSKTITSFTAVSGVVPYANVLGTGKLVLNADPKHASNVNRVKSGRESGDVGSTGNPIEYPILGDDTLKRVAGPASSTDWSFTFNPVRTDTVHKAIMDSDIGTKCVACVMRYVSATEHSFVIMEGTLASKSQSTPTGDTAQFTATMALMKAPQHVDHT